MALRVIDILKQAEGYISGEEISRQVKMSRAAVWKHIQQLRDQGYEVMAVPHLGYKLSSIPDKLFPQEIKANLNTEDFGVHIFYHEHIDSTMNHAFTLGMQGGEEGTLVIAEAQSKGRGRQGRAWSSPKGTGVYLSLILRPSLPALDVPKLTLMTAVAVADTVQSVAGVTAQIKWPNDLLVDGKKLAGILTEMRAEMDRVDFVVVGLGININNTQRQLLDTATSLKNEAKQTFSRVAVVQHILECWEKWYHVFLSDGFDPIALEWRRRSATLNKEVALHDGHNILRGTAIALADDGGLLIRCKDGKVVKKMAGDVTPMVSS